MRTSTRRSIPRSRSRCAVTGPTPHSASTGSLCRNCSTRSGAITVRPSGFFQPEAIFARNLFGATPADAVRPVVVLDLCLDPLRDRLSERFAPGVLGDVEVRLVERQRLDQRRHATKDREHGCEPLLYRAKSGRTITSDGHSRTARDIGIADRTPNARAS